MSEKSYISTGLESKIPSFILRDYPTFYVFLKKYYEWMDNNSFDALEGRLKAIDVSRCSEDDLEFHSENFLKDFPIDRAIESSALLKQVYKLYQSKGAEESYKFLFRSIYNADVSFYYPKEDILKASSGNYEFVFSLRVEYSDSFFGLEGKKIIGDISGAYAIVDKTISYFIGSFQIIEVILSEKSGNFLFDEKIYEEGNFDNFVYPYRMLTGITITNPGTGYSIGDTIAINNAGTNGIEGSAKILSIFHGSLDSIQIVSGGTGYSVGDALVFESVLSASQAKAIVSSVDGLGAITGIKLLLKGFNYSRRPSITVNSTGGSGASLSAVSSKIGGIKSVEITSFGVGYESAPSISFSSEGDGNAIGVAIIGTVSNTIGNWRNNNGFLSDKKFIIDSFFYQDFSYVLNSTVDPKDYEGFIRRVLHPSGMEMFTQQQFFLEINLGVLFNIITRDIDIYTLFILLGQNFLIELFSDEGDSQEEMQSLMMTYWQFDNMKYLFDSDILYSDFYHFHDILIKSFDETMKGASFDFLPDISISDINLNIPVLDSLILWIDGADDLTYGMDGSNNIIELRDKSPFGNKFVQSNPANRFKRGTNQINGIDVINSTTASFMVLNSPIPSFTSNDNTIFLVYNPTNLSNAFFAYGGSNGFTNLVPILTNPRPLLQIGYRDDTEYSIVINNTDYVTTPVGNADITNQMFHLGYNYNLVDEYFQGSIAEILIYNRKLNNAEIDSMRNYLISKWDIVV